MLELTLYEENVIIVLPKYYEVQKKTIFNSKNRKYGKSFSFL